MTIKYECDVCKKQFDSPSDVEIDAREVAGAIVTFEQCKKCAEKMFKPVKKYRGTMYIEENDERTR